MNKQLTIWYCHPYAGTLSAGKKKPNRAYFLSKEWVKLGHKPYVITSSYEHVGGLKSAQTEDYKFEQVDSFDFIWLKTPEYKNNGWRRILNMLSYARKLKKYAKNIIELTGRPDVIICSAQHPFHFAACLKIARKYNARLVSEIRDLWPLSLIEILGVNKYHPLCLLLSRIEKKMCLKSDAVVSLLKNANIYLEKKGLKKENFYWIPNGYQPLECDVNHPLENDADYQKIIELRHAGFFIIGYTGAHGKPNHLEMLCQAVSQIENEKIQLFLIGEGNIKKELIRQYDRFTNIHFIESKPMSCMSKFQQIFNLAYWGFLPAKIYESGLGANKSYEYMHNQVPILTSSVLEDTVVNEASCGIFFDPCSIESLRQAILFAVSLPQNELREIGSRGKKIICDHYIYSNLAKKYLAIFLNMIDDKANLSK